MMAEWINGFNSMHPNGIMVIAAKCSNCKLEIKYPFGAKSLFPSRCIFCNTPMENGKDEYNDSYDKQTGYYKAASEFIERHDKATELFEKAQKSANEYATFVHCDFVFRGINKEETQ